MSQLFFAVDGALEHPDQADKQSGRKWLGLSHIFKDSERVFNRAKYAGWKLGEVHPMVEKYPKLMALDGQGGGNAR